MPPPTHPLLVPSSLTPRVYADDGFGNLLSRTMADAVASPSYAGWPDKLLERIRDRAAHLIG